MSIGQRFQVITNNEGSFKIYRAQWLWGSYAIRRLGTAVRNFLRHNSNGYLGFEEFLKGSFYGKPSDMNSISRYDDEPERSEDDNDWICEDVSKRDLLKFLRGLDNNDGYLYLEFRTHQGLNGLGPLKGYCFLSHADLTVQSAVEYLSSYDRIEGFTKCQEKEFVDGLKTFAKLTVITPPRWVRAKRE